MPDLIVGDLHLTDKPRDAYRFDIFPWIKQQQKKYNVEYTFIMGDLCDAKDRHTATLVNKVVDSLTSIDPVTTLLGNHDYIDPGNPFFGFLNYISCLICGPDTVQNYGIIPHCRTQALFDDACDFLSHREFDTLLLHNTFTGAVSETGAALSGLRPSWVDYFKPARVYAGDVHKPQTAGSVTYVGAPYHIRFGDNYQPRVLLLDGDNEKELYFPAPRKWKLHISSPDDLFEIRDLEEDDQVKITLNLAREEIPEWKAMRARIEAICREMCLEVYGISLKSSTTVRKAKDVNRLQADPKEILTSFALKENLSAPIKQAGMSFLDV